VSTGLAQQAAEQEPNDSATQAQRIVAGQHLDARLSTTADTDWYSFSLTAPQQVNLRAIPANTTLPWAPRDTLVAIYDRGGERRLAWNERCGGTHSDCGVTLPAGDYTCLVALQPTGSPGDYQLEFVSHAPRAIDVTEGPEPNDNQALGGTPTPFRLGDTLSGEIEPSDDADWFVFELTRPGIVQAACLDDGGIPQLDNTRLQLWRETSPGLWSALSTPSFTRNSHRVLDLMHTMNLPAANSLPAGRYAIQVDANQSTPNGTAPWDYRRVGKYALRTALIDLPGDLTGLGPTHEGPEPDNTAATATPLALGNDAIGGISDHGDTDWYRFEITAPTTIGATAEGFAPDAVAVTSVRLCDEAGNALASGTATSTAHGRLVHTLAAPGVYYLEVKGRLFSDTGGYVLHTGSCAPLYLASPPRPAPETRPEAAEAAQARRPAKVKAADASTDNRSNRLTVPPR
jgi:hypothetical protein